MGQLYIKDSPAAFADCVQALLKDEVNRKGMGHSACEVAEQHHVHACEPIR